VSQSGLEVMKWGVDGGGRRGNEEVEWRADGGRSESEHPGRAFLNTSPAAICNHDVARLTFHCVLLRHAAPSGTDDGLQRWGRSYWSCGLEITPTADGSADDTQQRGGLI